MANQSPNTSTSLQRQQGGQMVPSTRSTSSLSPYFPSLNTFDLLNPNPFSLMRRMREEMDRMIAEFSPRQWLGDGVDWAPVIEVAERNSKYIVRAELPGVKPEDVDVEVADHELILQGDRSFQRDETQAGVRRTERSYGHFYRAIPLPEEVNPDQIKASCENGVLEVTIPISQKQGNHRHIPVQATSGGSASNTRSGTPPGSATHHAA